jgi:membrane protease subunit HflK
MTEQSRKDNEDLKTKAAQQLKRDEFDAAGKSLSDALRFSFMILKVIMIILIIAFLASGFRTVGPDEKALVLRFGKIRGVTEERVLGPGAHWVFPYPIDEVVKIPVEKKVNLAVNSFWYYQTKNEILGEDPKMKPRVAVKLDPTREGYSLTRTTRQSGEILGSDGSDYNIVHSKWQLTYKIDDIEMFFKDVYVDEIKPGQIYFDVITDSIKPLLQNVFEEAVVTALVNYTIDEAIKSKDTIPRHVKRLVQQELDSIESGIKVISVYLTDITWPRQVDDAFLASIRASQESQKVISEARTYAENTLSEAGGPVAEQLLATLKDKSITEEGREYLWLQLAGSAQERIAEARAYRTQVVETAKANAEYLQQLLPEYRKRPELVIQKIYQDTIEFVLNNADEKFVIQPTEGAAGKELRIMVNRDPSLKLKSSQPSGQTGQE